MINPMGRLEKALYALVLFTAMCLGAPHAHADLVIDNGDLETSFTSTWRVSNGADPLLFYFLNCSNT
jgi:hypothetical protein